MTNSVRRRPFRTNNRDLPQCQVLPHEDHPNNFKRNFYAWCPHSNYRPNLITNLLPHPMEITTTIKIWESSKLHFSIDPIPSGPLNSKTLIQTSGKSLKRLYGTIPQPKVITPAVTKKSSLKSTQAAHKCPMKAITNLSSIPSLRNLPKIHNMSPLFKPKGSSTAGLNGNAILQREPVTIKNYWNSWLPLSPILRPKKYFATVKKPNAWNFTATVSVSIKLVMAATARGATTWKNSQKKEALQSWFWWIEILIRSV